jgi:hypothetical protein
MLHKCCTIELHLSPWGLMVLESQLHPRDSADSELTSDLRHFPWMAEARPKQALSSCQRGGPGCDLAHGGWHTGSPRTPSPEPSSPLHLTAELAPAHAGRADLWLGLPPSI